MRTHTNEFKEELKVFGRQIQGKIVYYPSYDLISESDDNILTEAALQIISEQANYDEPIEIDAEDIFSISIIKNGDLLQSLMKEFDFESKIELNIGSVVNPQFGLLVNEEYEYLNYGNYIINSKEFNMDTETWSYVCYDKMLFSMVKYRGLNNIEYPITIKQFINNLCNKVGLEFEDSQFVNQNQLIYEDLYKNRDVTYRDIFDEISKIVAGNLLINDNDKLEVGYPNKASYSENTSGSDISIEAVEEPILDVKLEGDTQQNTSILPSGYTQVDYIESSGTQYIDSGILPSENIGFEIDFTPHNDMNKTTARTIFGSRTTWKSNGYQLTTYTEGDLNGGHFLFGTNNTASLIRHSAYMQKNVRCQISFLNGVFKSANGNETNIQGTFSNVNKNIYLFGCIQNVNQIELSTTTLYKLKFYDNGNLIRDFIPCYRNSDNVVGLYDIVNNVFYTNQGTGAFTYGSVVNIPNPDYPQDINVVTGEQNVEISNNIFKEYEIENVYFRANDTVFHGTTAARTVFIEIEPNTTYTVYRTSIIQNNFDVATSVNKPLHNGAITNVIENSTGNSITITSGDNDKYLSIYCWWNSSTPLNDIINTLRIAKGESYQSQNYPIDLGNIELCKIGDYQDYIYYNNGWYLHKETNKFILNGTQNITAIAVQTNTTRVLYTGILSNYQSTPDRYPCFSNMFKYLVNWNIDNEGIYTNSNDIVFRINKEKATTKEEINQILSQINLEVLYSLQNPQDIKITNVDLINQLNDLKNATLYNGTSNINVNEDLPTILNLDYISEYEKINEDYLKDTNVRMSEKIGVINSIAILDSDNDFQYIAEDTQSIKENEMTRVTITDNLIAMNGETQEIADNILNKLNGLYYYANDLQTTGVCYYDFLDMFSVEARGNIYQCLLLNNEITITQGIEEHIFTERFEEVETNKNEYTTSVISNKEVQFKINQQEGRIESKVEKDGVISAINQSAEEIQINANRLNFEGKTINLTGENIKIKGDKLDIDSKGQITLFDDSAEKAFSAEDPDMAYIIQSTFNDEYQGQNNYLNFGNKIFANGRKNEYENNNEIQQSTGYGHYFGGIEENLYRYPMQRLYFHSEDYDQIQQTGSLQELNLSVNMLYFLNYNGSSQLQPIILDGSTGNIRCVSLTQTSKVEDKKNFEKLTNAKDILNQVDIYKYNFKDEDDNVKKSIGFVIGDNFNYSQEITSTNNDGANIYSMVSVLWQVVKEQQEEIKELKEMIKNGKY